MPLLAAAKITSVLARMRTHCLLMIYHHMDFIPLGNELIYLDPHTTQSFVDSEENGTVDDESFHCQQAPHHHLILDS